MLEAVDNIEASCVSYVMVGTFTELEHNGNLL